QVAQKTLSQTHSAGKVKVRVKSMTSPLRLHSFNGPAMNDSELLSAFSTTASPQAFEQIVRNNIHLVYGAALRQTRDPHLADDVTQSVFIILARKARTLRDPAMLPGWLISTTRYASLNAKKFESRRRIHEQKAASMAPISTDDVPVTTDNTDIASLLDQALGKLRTNDRSALVLRYLRGLPVKAVAAELLISPVAAEKRIARALLKLRQLLGRKGINTAADALESALAAQSLALA